MPRHETGHEHGRTPQISVSFAGAPDLIAARLLKQGSGSGPARPAVVGITGPVGAGKSTLAALLSTCIISTDHYLPDYDAVPEHRRDLPEESDLARLAHDLANLRRGEPADIPLWTFQTHKRIGTQRIHPAPVVVVEGLHALHPVPAGALDLRVYIDAPADVRWTRWEHLERSGQRGWGVEVARAFFDNVAEPTFHARAAAYRAAAHIVVINDAPASSAP